MDLSPYIVDLQRQLVSAADGDDARQLAERLVGSLDATARLALLDVLSAAAAEITRDLAPGSVDVRLRGREVEFVVVTPIAEAETEAEAPTDAADLDEPSTSRTTLRLPDALKARVDAAAAAEHVSVNTWLVRAIASALKSKHHRDARRTLQTGDSFAGWAR